LTEELTHWLWNAAPTQGRRP